MVPGRGFEPPFLQRLLSVQYTVCSIYIAVTLNIDSIRNKSLYIAVKNKINLLSLSVSFILTPDCYI